MKFRYLLFFVLLLFSVPLDLHAESLLYEHYPQKQVAPATSYTETFTISGAPSNAVLTNVEVQFDYIAYGVYQDYVSSKINKDSTAEGEPILQQGMLPAGNPGTYGYVAASNWNNQSLVNNSTTFHVRFAVAAGCPGSPTISTVRLRITYSVINPSVSVSPTIGPQGTTFQEPGTGFTPNSTATMHFTRPGLGETTLAVGTDGNGAYNNSWLCDACPVGTYQYWAVDDTSGKASNTVTFTVTNAVDPQVSVSPSTGPQGTIFQEPGTGFTPNSTATLHFKHPDGTEADTVVKNTESTGSFTNSWTCDLCPVGTYQYWAIDNTTGVRSNTASFTVTGPSDLNRGLIAFYPFNGNGQDESGNGNDGTADGTTLIQDRFGNPNSAYSFDGVNDYISVPELLSPPIQSFTFSVWASAKALADSAAVYQGTVNGEAQIGLSNGNIFFAVKISDVAQGSWYTASDNQTFALDKFVHLVGVYNRGSRIELWLNGQLIKETLVPEADLYVEKPTSFHYSAVGASRYMAYNYNFWNGVIDDVRIYNRALTELEIQELYNTESQPPPSVDPNWVKTYRLVRAGNGHQDHLYTTSLNEKESAEASGYIYDGEDFMVSSAPFTGGVEVARLRKDGPNYKIRLYATGATEIQSAKNQGYVQEGSLGYIYGLFSKIYG